MEQQRKEDFGKYLKLLRKEKKYKQDEVAEFLGIKRQAYSHYETGRNFPPVETISKIAELYQIEPLKLFMLLSDAGNGMITSEEMELLEYFRQLDVKDQTEILEICKLKRNMIRK